jgi:hypothetical protein
MLGRNNYQIMVTNEFATTEDGVIGNIQRLRIHLAVHPKVEFQTKRTRVNVAWRECEFLRIPTGPRIVIMVGENIRRETGRAVSKTCQNDITSAAVHKIGVCRKNPKNCYTKQCLLTIPFQNRHGSFRA